MACVSALLCDFCAEIEKPLHLLHPHICVGVNKTVISNTPSCLHVHLKPTPICVRPAPPPPPPKPICVCSKYTFELSIDMSQYQLEEIHVSTVNNVIVIEAKHEEKHGDCGHITKEFLRRCTLPDQNDINKVKAVYTNDGILKITAPKKNACKPGERIIPVVCPIKCCC